MHIFPRSLLVGCMSACVLALGAGTFNFLTKNPRQPDLAGYSEILPTVRTIVLQPQQISLSVYSQGLVAAEQSTTVSAQVGGRIIEVSPDLKPGLAVKKGQILLHIEPDDYATALSLAKAQLAEAEATLVSEQARAAQASPLRNRVPTRCLRHRSCGRRAVSFRHNPCRTQSRR